MKSIYLYFFAGLLLLASCKGDEYVPNTDIEVASAFIKNILQNNFKKASTFLLPDETNEQYFNLFKKEFEAKTKENLQQYKDADIIIKEISNVNDTVSIVNYSNTFMPDKSNKVKMVRVNGKWLVDFKYTFSGNL